MSLLRHATMRQSPDEIAHGAMFVGVILSVCLYGILIVQTLMYFRDFKQDPTWRKYLVGFLFILETANAVIDVTFAYESLIPHFGNAPYFQDNYLFVTCSVTITVIIALCIQLFFAGRIRVLTSSKLFTSVIVICALASFSGGIFTAISTSRIRGFFLFLSFVDFQTFKKAILAWFVSDSLTNVILTVTLVWYLKSHKTGFQDTDGLIDNIIRITVPTGMTTTVFSAMYIILFFVDTINKPELVFYFPLSKLYTNSMLSSLNSRRRAHHVRLESGSQGGSPQGRSRSGDVPQMMERQQAHTGDAARHYHQDPVGQSGNGRAEVFVQVDSHQVIEISRGNIPARGDNYTSGWEDD